MISRNRLEGLDAAKSVSDGERAAELLKFYRRQCQLSVQLPPAALNRVKAQGFYEEHMSAFNRLAGFFKDHGLDLNRYVKYFAENLDKAGIDLDKNLISRYSLEKYCEWMHGVDKRKRIYGWFMKSAKNLAEMSFAGGYLSPKDCFIDALKQKRLSQLIVSGQISVYFLAAIPGFRNVIPKLDMFARQDLAELYDRFDMYSTDVNEAILAVRNRYANPFKIAANELAGIRASRKAESRPDDGLFDDSL